MKRNKTLSLKMTLCQAISISECLKNDIVVNQHILDDNDINPESWKIAKNNIDTFRKLQKSLLNKIDTLKNHD